MQAMTAEDVRGAGQPPKVDGSVEECADEDGAATAVGLWCVIKGGE